MFTISQIFFLELQTVGLYIFVLSIVDAHLELFVAGIEIYVPYTLKEIYLILKVRVRLDVMSKAMALAALMNKFLD